MSITGFPTKLIQDMSKDMNDPNIKQYLDYDGDGDVVDIYKAQAEAGNGDACLRNRLSYATVSGNKLVQKISWESATWDSSWDI